MNSAEINDSGANIGFEHEDTKFVFASGNILAIRGEKNCGTSSGIIFLKKTSKLHLENYREQQKIKRVTKRRKTWIMKQN